MRGCSQNLPAGAALWAALAASLTLACSAALAQQPNVVFIISDDAGWADFGFNDQGNGEIPTPALDSIAGSGRWFRAAYTAPVCSPSRARIFLGQHNQRTGYDNNAPDSLDASDAVVQGLRLEDTTLFERMSGAGYHVGYFGKWHLGTELDVVQGNTVVTEGNLPVRHGIDYFWGITSGSRSYFINDASGYTKLLREMTLDEQSNLITDTVVENNYPTNAYLTDILASEVADYITQQSQSPGPFFAIASFTAPHGPLQATQQYFDRVDALNLGYTGNRRTYAAMMLAFDDGVQTILDRLDDPDNDGSTADSVRANTVVVFINDNGGETANSARNFPLRGKKSDTFDGGIRVMMAMSGPGIPATGASFDFPVDSVDLTPTFLALAGQPLGPEDATDGVNLLPYLDGTMSGPPRENLFVRGNNPITAGARQGDFKLTIENIGGPFLYDIVGNPGENNVLNTMFPDVVDEMTDIMNAFEAEYMKPRWGPTDVNSTLDDFVYRAGAVGSSGWSSPGVWSGEGGSPASVTMYARDGYANHTMRFPANQVPYTAANNLSRPDGLPFIANAISFSGDYAGASDSGATLTGQPIMMVDSLDGDLPSIDMAIAASSTGQHPARIELEIRVWDDVTIAGDGSEALVLAGGVVAERSGRTVTKVSTGPLSFENDVSFAGAFNLTAGQTRIADNARVGAQPLAVRDGGALQVGDGAIVDAPDLLANTGVLAVSTPSTGGPSVHLNYQGIDLVDGLVIDGVPQPLGTYGAGSHPAIFSGDGLVSIRGPLDCDGDVNEDGFADTFDTLEFLRVFDAASGCGLGGPALPAGVTINCEAPLDVAGDGIWDVVAPGTDTSRAWTFGGSQTPVATDGAPSAIPVAYAFPGAAASGPDYEDPSRSPSTIELWLKTDDFTGDQIIWEAGGGTRGGVIWLSGNELRLDVQNSIPAPARASTTLGAGWHQVVAVIDINNAVSKLYVDGQLRDTASIGTDRWAGGNPSGLGQVVSSAAGNITPPNFRGQIGIYRTYNGRALSDSDIMQAFRSVTQAAEPCDQSIDLDNDGLLTGGDVIIHLQQLVACGE